jgi:alkylhydroperoxidase/carboxymuconolactone decarboxylase family protein YurZ
MRGRLWQRGLRGLVDAYKQTLRKLAIRDTELIQDILERSDRNVARSAIDPRAHALVRIGALVTADAATPSFMDACDEALAAGATREEIVGTLIAVLPLIGVERVVAAAPNLARALDYDIGAALEMRDHDTMSGDRT